MTQTTVERIAAIIESGYTEDGFGNFDGFPVAVEIAAEIGAKDATIDRLQRELAEARAYISTIIDAREEG